MMLSPLRLFGLAAAVAALCAVAGAPVAAQQAQTELQSWQVPGWSFTPGVAFGTVYDSNVAIAGPDVSGSTASDSLLRIEPFGQLEFFSARTSFSSGYRGSVRRYFELSALDGLDHRLYATLRHRITRRVSLFLDESFQQAPTTDAIELNGLPFARVGTRHNMFGGGVDARVTKALDWTAGYELGIVDFVGEATPLSRGVVHGIRTALTHRLGQRTSAGGEYGIRLADLNDGLRQFHFHNAGGVVQYRTGEHTTLDLNGGLTYLVDRLTDETRTGPYVRAAIEHRAPRATIGGEYNRSYSPSIALGGTMRAHEARGYVDMPFRRNRLYVQESASWRRTDPFTATEPALASVWVHSTLGYAIRRWMRLEGQHTFTSQDNRLAGGRVTRHMLGVHLVVSEPMRIR